MGADLGELRTTRKEEIRQAIVQGISRLSEKEWIEKDSPELSKAEADLNEVMTQFVDGEVSKAEVRTAFKTWADLHVRK